MVDWAALGLLTGEVAAVLFLLYLLYLWIREKLEKKGHKKSLVKKEKKLVCSFCSKKLDALYFDAWRCEYCGKIFCSSHINWKNHKCKKVPKNVKLPVRHKIVNIPVEAFMLLLPLLLGLIGGIISFLWFKEKNRKLVAVFCLSIGLLYSLMVGILFLFPSHLKSTQPSEEVSQETPKVWITEMKEVKKEIIDEENVTLPLNHYFYTKFYANATDKVRLHLGFENGTITFYLLYSSNCLAFLNYENFNAYVKETFVPLGVFEREYKLNKNGEWCIIFYNSPEFNNDSIELAWIFAYLT
jgi:ribosomal protein L37AE/L43A